MAYEARYNYRIYPDDEQRTNFAQTFGCARFAYNWALRLRSDEYHTSGKSIRYGDTSKALTELKKQDEYVWLNDVSCVPVQQSLRHLDSAYQRFFRGEAKFPQFKKKRSAQSAEYTKSAYRLSGDPLMPTVQLAKQKNPLRIVWSRPLPSEPSSLTITRDAAGRYFISFVVRVEPEVLPPIDKAVGLDMGLTHSVITSDGWKAHNPKYLERDLAKLRRAQKSLSRKKEGSQNWRKQKAKVARIHARISDRRTDYIHKLTTKIVRENGVICTETLRVQNMVKNHCLARSISDVSWGTFLSLLEYKAKWYGRTLVKIDQWYPSSKRCSACGHIEAKMPLDVREWICPECGCEHDRDVNAASNILAAGLAVLASGLSVSPADASALVGCSG